MPNEVMELLKHQNDDTPIVSNTLANYRDFQLQKESKCNLLNKDISSVLVICTGGTFCMVKTPKGYVA